MKFADDEHLTPVGIWLKRKLITFGNLVRKTYKNLRTRVAAS